MAQGPKPALQWVRQAHWMNLEMQKLQQSKSYILVQGPHR